MEIGQQQKISLNINAAILIFKRKRYYAFKLNITIQNNMIQHTFDMSSMKKIVQLI